MIRAVCFDLDGTIFDDRQYIRAGLRAAADFIEDETGVTVEDDLFEAFFQQGIRERTFDHVLECHDLPTQLVPNLVEAYHEHGQDITPYPEAECVLAELQRDYRLGLLTGGTNGNWKVDKLNVRRYFDAVIVAPALGLTKRERTSFKRLLDAVGADPSEAVYVGDRPTLDFPHPNELGMYTIRVSTGQYANVDPKCDEAVPDVTVESIDKVPDVLTTFE